MLPEGAGCLRNRRRLGMTAWVGALLGILLLAIPAGAQSATGVDVSIVSLHVGWTFGLDQALVGDTVRISALVKNAGTEAVGQFTVDFFFTETITGEHGKIGTQTVSGLAPGEETRPVISFETAGFTPGIYVFSAEADAPETLGEADRCNNVTPREACDGSTAERTDKYTLTLLQSGRHISELALQGTFPLCRMGELDTRWTFDVYNVGTEPLQLVSSANLDVSGYYRLALTPPANVFEALSGAEDLDVFGFIGSPGSQGSLTIELDYTSLQSEFRPTDTEADAFHVLGYSDQAQLRVSVGPTGDDAGLARDAFFPDQYKLSHFYSTVDAWTFPARQQCRCEETDEYGDIESVPVMPVVVGGRVFHVVTTTSGSDRLHVLSVDSGEEQAVWSSSGELTAPVVAYDDSGAVDVYRIYIGADDGTIRALQYTLGETELLTLWQSESGLVTGRDADGATTFLLLSSDDSEMVIGSGAGAFVLDTSNGSVLRSYTDAGATSPPGYADETGILWVPSGSTIHAFGTSGELCSYDVGDRVTTSVKLNHSGTVAFFGTDGGDLLAIASSTGAGCTVKAQENSLARRAIIGLDLYSDDDDAQIYVTSTIGEIAGVEYRDSQSEFRDVTEGTDSREPNDILTAPAVFAADGEVKAVAVTGWERKTDQPALQVWESGLDDYEQVNVWGNDDVWFVFMPEEDGVVPDALLSPLVAVVDEENESAYVLVGCSNGYLYAFDLGQLW